MTGTDQQAMQSIMTSYIVDITMHFLLLSV
jgi:hypothetical protein